MVRAVQQLSGQVSDAKVKQMLEHSVGGIQKHTDVLKGLIQASGGETKPEHCKGMEGLVAELLVGGRRHLAFFHTPDWLAGIAVEHEHKPLFGGLDHDIPHSFTAVDSRKRRLRRQIVIPDIMMDGLIRPQQFAGLRTKRYDGIGVGIVAGPLPAPEVRARRRGG